MQKIITVLKLKEGIGRRIKARQMFVRGKKEP